MQEFKVTVNGRVFEVKVEPVGSSHGKVAPQAQSASPMEVQPKASEPVRELAVSAEETPIPSPLAGTIMSVKVKEGDTVKAGQVLLTLEALKMENEIVAPEGGVVSSIFVKDGNSVNVGDMLVALKNG